MYEYIIVFLLRFSFIFVLTDSGGFIKTMKYPSDLTDPEWESVRNILTDALPEYKTGRRKATDELREIFDAILYINKTGTPWQYLPNDYPPPTTVFYHYSKWKKLGLFEKINTVLREQARKKLGRSETPTGALIDSQSIKSTPEAGGFETGTDGGKLVHGRKRTVITDTLGFLIVAVVSSANTSDKKAAVISFQKLFELCPDIVKIWADNGYRGDLVEWLLETFNCILEITNKTWSGFKVEAKRWVVERTLAWLTRARRLAKEYEKTVESSVSMVYIASIRILLKKIYDN